MHDKPIQIRITLADSMGCVTEDEFRSKYMARFEEQGVPMEGVLKRSPAFGKVMRMTDPNTGDTVFTWFPK